MASCKDCIHYDVCEAEINALEMNGIKKISPSQCGCFKPKSRYIVLPCAVGDFVYVIYGKEVQPTKVFSVKIESEDDHYVFYCKCMVHQGGARFEKFIYGKTVFLAKEEAEKALQEKQQ